LAPLVRAGLVEGTPIVDAKSGVSGAGRSKTDSYYTFSELSGTFQSYGVVGHRHTPEIEQTVGCRVRFVPHLAPMARGIHTTIHLRLKPGVGAAQVAELWQETYRGRRFVRVQEKGLPSTKQVLGSNRCDVAVQFDERTGFATLLSVIDNMVKGAAGQAIQNMNVMAGLPEETGLPLNGVWP
jgi:N-acetyl-gamma-glutamyl-phosphate reductase